jgi:hypothetical protein
MKINPGKSKAMRAWVKNALNYSLGYQTLLKVSSCRYLEIIVQNNLNWVDPVNDTVHKVSKALHFIMCMF